MVTLYLLNILDLPLKLITVMTFYLDVLGIHILLVGQREGLDSSLIGSLELAPAAPLRRRITKQIEKEHNETKSKQLISNVSSV